MADLNYAKICTHERITRLNDNFVRCLNCGQSLVSQKYIPGNKTRNDFTNENKLFSRNFDRNFTNVLEEVDSESNRPHYEYYSDKNWTNGVIIKRAVEFSSNPPKFQVIMNGQVGYLDNDKIRILLSNLNAIRIDEEQFKTKFKW